MSCCCCLFTQWCLTVCDPTVFSTPGFPIHHQLPELVQTHVHWVEDAAQPSRPLSPLLLLPSIFPSIRVFSNESALGGQSIGASSSASVLPMNTQGWFPLGLTGFISLQSKGLSRVFSNTTAQKASFLQHSASPYGPTLTSIHDY